MKLIDSSVEILPQSNGLEGVYKQIEIAGRTSYKSDHLIKENSAKPFVERLISYKHYSPLEHGTVYLKIPVEDYSAIDDYVLFRFFNVTNYHKGYAYVTTNYRFILEHNLENNLQWLCKPTKHHEKRVTIRVRCSIGVSREWNRHRTLSIVEQSTRYCNYSKDKFDNELTFIKPYWLKKVNEITQINLSDTSIIWHEALKDAEKVYLSLLDKGAKPQEARSVLPLDTATEVVYTGFIKDWIHFFDLRCDSHAHPDINKLANELKNLFIINGYLT